MKMLSAIFVDLDNQKVTSQDLVLVLPKLFITNPLTYIVANDTTYNRSNKIIKHWRENGGHILVSGHGNQVTDLVILSTLTRIKDITAEVLVVTRDYKLLRKINKTSAYSNILKHSYNKQDKTFITNYKGRECKVVL